MAIYTARPVVYTLLGPVCRVWTIALQCKRGTTTMCATVITGADATDAEMWCSLEWRRFVLASPNRVLSSLALTGI
jgi:hypothetical protein